MLVLMTIEDMLGDLGCTSISAAGSVEAALQCIAAGMFDLATLDLNLNGTRSYAVAAALEDHQIPFAFATGYGERGVDAAYAGHPVLTKPFTRVQFENAVSSLLAEGAPPVSTGYT